MKNKKHVRQKSRKGKIPSPRIPRDYPWKVLQSLSLDLKQYLKEEDYNLISSIVERQSIEDYMSLSEIWGLQSRISVDIPIPELRARLSIANVLKKFCFEGDQTSRKKKAIEKFLITEQACKTFNDQNWKRLSIANNDLDLCFNTYIQSFIRKVIGDEPDFLSFDQWVRHGPGSTTQTSGVQISNYWKFCNWPYDVTACAIPYAVETIKNDERWLGALEDSYRQRYNIPSYAILNQEVFWSSVFKIVNGNRITTVPKTAQIERTIAIEPTINLYLQLGVDGFIRKRLKRFGVDLDSQEKNRKLAYLGSISNEYDTLDLSSASDSISTELIRRIFPSQWFRLLDDLRSHNGLLDNNLITYEKFSSMGNGFTFAIESLIFTAIVYAAYKILGQKLNYDEVAIFGDDIIVSKNCTATVIHGLELCGFTINLDKSFLTENFIRESCGTDWRSGFTLRSVYLKEYPKTIKNLYTDYNQIKRSLSLWYSQDDSLTCQFIKSLIPTGYCLYGPYSDDEFDTYIHSPIKGKYSGYCYHFRRLVALPIPYRGPTVFLFRKLMTNLSGIKKRSIETLSKSGNVFLIADRNKVRYAIVPAPHTDNWCDRYSPFPIEL